MNIEQERADFEAFARPRNYDLDAVMLLSKPPKFLRYANPATQDAFEAYQAGRAALQSQDREDAERYRWLRDTLHGAKAGGGVEVNDALQVYETPEPGEEVRVYWYQDTPVGFYQEHGTTLDEAIDHARRIEGEGE